MIFAGRIRVADLDWVNDGMSETHERGYRTPAARIIAAAVGTAIVLFGALWIASPLLILGAMGPGNKAMGPGNKWKDERTISYTRALPRIVPHRHRLDCDLGRTV